MIVDWKAISCTSLSLGPETFLRVMAPRTASQARQQIKTTDPPLSRAKKYGQAAGGCLSRLQYAM
jgi:hypothetical protein